MHLHAYIHFKKIKNKTEDVEEEEASGCELSARLVHRVKWLWTTGLEKIFLQFYYVIIYKIICIYF